jgi:type I restriction enzyme S subunit
MKFRWETEFKETEIGEIPREWEVKKLGDMATIKTGKTDVKDAVEDGEYPLFDRSDQIKRSNKYLFVTEAVIVPGEGKDFTPRYYKGKFDLHQRTYAIFDFKELNGKYLFFAMHILRHTLRDFAVGSTVESLRLPILKNLDIPYPPLPEQSRIATVLSWFDDLIEVKKRQNEILEKIAMAIFKSWFIDFEPFRDGEFVYSEELGKEIPKGWGVKRIIDLSSIVSGRGRYLIEASEGIYPLWGANGVLGYIENYDLEGFSIITGRVGTLGNVFLIEGKFAISDNVLCIIPHQDFWVFFLFLWIKSQIDFESLNVGTSQPLITKTALGNQPLIFPPSPILQSFHSLIEPLFQKIILNHKQIMTLRKIRDTLLPLLVFGKLRVEEL